MSKRDKAKVARKAAKDASLPTPAGVDAGAWVQFLDKKSDDMTICRAIADTLDLDLPEIDVDDFRRSGYLPQVLVNYLALLGWNPGGDIERFDAEFLTERFDFDRVGKSASKFDRDKLFRFNGDTIAELEPAQFIDQLKTHFKAYHPEFLDKLNDEQFALFAESYRPRSRTLSEPAALGRFFIFPDDEILYDPKAVKKVLRKNEGEGLTVLEKLKDELETCEPWQADAIDKLIRGYAEQHDLGLGKVAQPLRVAVTGSTVSPAIHDTLTILGKTSTLARIDRCMRNLANIE